MHQYTEQSLVTGINLIGITFGCNRNLHEEQCSEVNSSLKGSKCKADLHSF